MPTKIVVHQQLTFSEYLVVNYIYIISNWKAWACLGFVMGVAALKPLIRSMRYDRPFQWAPLLAVLITLFVVAVFAVWLICRVVFTKNKWMFHNVAYAITDDGFKRVGERFAGFTPWNEVKRVFETPGLIILYSGPFYHIFQKRMFGSASELSIFRAFLNNKRTDSQRHRSL